jgi:hypothetical protein
VSNQLAENVPRLKVLQIFSSAWSGGYVQAMRYGGKRTHWSDGRSSPVEVYQLVAPQLTIPAVSATVMTEIIRFGPSGSATFCIKLAAPACQKSRASQLLENALYLPSAKHTNLDLAHALCALSSGP